MENDKCIGSSLMLKRIEWLSCEGQLDKLSFYPLEFRRVTRQLNPMHGEVLFFFNVTENGAFKYFYGKNSTLDKQG